MSDTMIRVLMWGAGILLAIIGFFAAYYFQRTMIMLDKLSSSISRLQSSISGIDATIVMMQNNLNTSSGVCKEKYDNIRERLDSHDDLLLEHSKSIAAHEAKLYSKR